MKNYVDIPLGNTLQMKQLFSWDEKTGVRYYDFIAHVFNQTLQRDLFYGAWASVREEGSQCNLKLTSPLDDISVYETKIAQWLEAGKLGYSIYESHKAVIGKAGLDFLLPFGLSMIRAKSVQLLHFPPEGTLDYRDYLYSATNRRWESLLYLNGCIGNELSLLECIIDIVPLVAPSGDLKGIAPFNEAFIPYGKKSLEASLTLKGCKTQPVVGYGAPVYEWLENAYADQIKQPLKTLSLAYIKILGEIETPVLCTNHPSEFIFVMDKNPELAASLVRQDLIAAHWQMVMADNWDGDADEVLKSAIDYWNNRPDEIKSIIADQKKEFGFLKF